LLDLDITFLYMSYTSNEINILLMADFPTSNTIQLFISQLVKIDRQHQIHHLRRFFSDFDLDFCGKLNA